VGLHTLAAAMDLNLQLVNPASPVQDHKFQGDDFDSGDARNINLKVFEHDQPILAMILCVFGDEIDSQDFYDDEMKSRLEFFFQIVGAEAAIIASGIGALKAAGISLAALGTAAIWAAAIAGIIILGIDILVALWAPADPIMRDIFGLSVNDLATLTSANAPAPDPRTFTTEENIVVNVNKTIPPVKLPLEYHETREYVSDGSDSRYEITYRFNRVA
jgi:hypothetical protein